MSAPILLASASPIRATLLRRAGLSIQARPAQLDETALRAGLQAEGAGPRDIADALAEGKARKLSGRDPEALVIGCDQILACDGVIHTKPASLDDARAQLVALRDRTHRLFTAAVIFRDGRPLWRHVAVARMTMRPFSDSYLDSYIARNWPGLAQTVGGYKLEEEGVRLFARIEGCHFAIQGLPLPECLGFLTGIGAIEG